MNLLDAKPASLGGYILIWWPQPPRLTAFWKINTFAGIPVFTLIDPPEGT